MKRTLGIIGLIIGIPVIGYGIYTIVKEQIKLLYSYCWRVKDVLINNISTDNVNLTVLLQLKNQSDIDIIINKYNLDIYINDFKVANVINSDINNWKSKSVSEIKFDVNFNPRIIFKDINKITNLVANILAEPKNIIITTKGTVSIKHSFIQLEDVKIDYTTTLKDIQSDDETLYKCKIEENDKK